MGKNRNMAMVGQNIEALLSEKGLDGLDGRLLGSYVGFRLQEFLAALNRLRTLRIE